MFDLAVNGGGKLSVKFERPGYCPAQRHVLTPWADYLCLPEVVLITMDPAVNPVVMGNNSPFQVARGSMQTDADGSRQATLMLSPGTCANLVINGVTQSCGSLNIRARITVGSNGPATMPRVAANSACTYCVELSADEATAAASDRAIDRRLFYLENFSFSCRSVGADWIF